MTNPIKEAITALDYVLGGDPTIMIDDHSANRLQDALDLLVKPCPQCEGATATHRVF